MLNHLQQAVFNAVTKDKEKAILCLGEGGTGKSYVASKIIEHFKNEGKSVLVTATTNKAAQELSLSSGEKATTIHKALGFSLINGSDYNKFLAKVKGHSSADLLIIDEISMIPPIVLQEVLDLLDNGDFGQVLFLGDPLQLPPVNEGGVIPKDIPSITLTQQMRQDEGDTELRNLLKNLRKGIEGLEHDKMKPIPSVKYITDHKEFAKLYNECETSKKILAYRNNVVDKYNEYCSGGVAFSEGDDVIIDKPLKSANNQDTVRIINIEEDENKYDMFVRNMYGETKSIMQFKTATAKEEYLDQWKSVNDVDGYWEEEAKIYQLKQAYACTVHKSQGSTYETVFVDARDIIYAHEREISKYGVPISRELLLRLMYVAISRMKGQCYLFVGKKRDYKKFKPNTKKKGKK